ncbi:hypothetical protein CL630_03330 [bacterium]|nr:hypothetical protein [bacterium]|tara:strand:+ start:36151 stop:37092 length:942 start_codon:yes stop_codon:yes gene_type:complete
MDILTLYATAGFMLAAFSVVGNDSAQILGTFLASNRAIKWYYLWLGATLVLIFTLVYGWYIYGGDISYGRLKEIPHMEIEWYHAAAPGVLVILTRFGVPVSTTFLVLSTFASEIVLKEILEKSFVGYGLAAVVAYGLWFTISNFDKDDPVKESHKFWWRVFQWMSTGFLWFTWLSHDMANIAAFLPRQLPLPMLIGVIGILSAGLAYIFWNQGGKIQEIILEKHSTRYVRSATIIDLVYGLILLFFKELNDIPMSTTWVFVGLLAGRELAIATVHKKKKIKAVFPLITKDFFKMMIGLGVSVAIVVLIHNVFT